MNNNNINIYIIIIIFIILIINTRYNYNYDIQKGGNNNNLKKIRETFYRRVNNKYIPSGNRTIINNTTVKNCMKMCDRVDWCKSFQYKNKQCKLNENIGPRNFKKNNKLYIKQLRRQYEIRDKMIELQKRVGSKKAIKLVGEDRIGNVIGQEQLNKITDIDPPAVPIVVKIDIKSDRNCKVLKKKGVNVVQCIHRYPITSKYENILFKVKKDKKPSLKYKLTRGRNLWKSL